MNITLFEQTQEQRTISAFGRRMVDLSENDINAAPLEILNAFSRVGEHIAETGSLKGLSETDRMVIKFAAKLFAKNC